MPAFAGLTAEIIATFGGEHPFVSNAKRGGSHRYFWARCSGVAVTDVLYLFCSI
jgi:hypothetical protein